MTPSELQQIKARCEEGREYLNRGELPALLKHIAEQEGEIKSLSLMVEDADARVEAIEEAGMIDIETIEARFHDGRAFDDNDIPNLIAAVKRLTKEQHLDKLRISNLACRLEAAEAEAKRLREELQDLNDAAATVRDTMRWLGQG